MTVTVKTLAFSATEARVIAASLDMTATMLAAIGDSPDIHEELAARFTALAEELDA